MPLETKPLGARRSVAAAAITRRVERDRHRSGLAARFKIPTWRVAIRP